MDSCRIPGPHGGRLYVGIQPMHPAHIYASVIQRSARRSALGRLAYQACTSFENDFRKADYSQFSEHHRGHVILLPEGAPPEFAEMESFLMATAFRETRIDAQEGRAVDFSVPRAVPEALLLPVAAFTMTPFVELVMAAWIDVEYPPASDGELDPHCHVYLSQRVLGVSTAKFGSMQSDLFIGQAKLGHLRAPGAFMGDVRGFSEVKETKANRIRIWPGRQHLRRPEPMLCPCSAQF